ncbi:MAG: uncharacterized protein JWL84_3178 [Rhodospirillales bacterium]|jgi:hypothetical protein|nr:uncharacterized protein [Rhodospirillales bacterium]
MKAKAYVVHSLPGRVRIKVPERRGDSDFFDDIKRRLERLDGVSHVATNPVTGSILVQHEGEIADLVMQALGADIGNLLELALHAPPVAQRLCLEMAAIDRNIKRVTAGELDLGTLASLGLLAMAAGQLLYRRQPAIAVSMSWYASELLRRSCDGNAIAERVSD